MRRSLLACAAALFAAGCFSRPASAPPVSRVLLRTSGRAGDIPRPYSQVITSEAKTSSGMFKTHQVGERLYFEIPRSELGKDMLLVGRFAKTGSGNPRGMFTEVYAGDEFTERVLTWDRQGNKIVLRAPSFEVTADSTLPVYQAVNNSNNPPIIAIFNVEAYGPDSSAVIDVTRLYITNAVPEFMSIKGNIDPGRSFIEQTRAFAENVEVEATQTITPQNANQQSYPVPFESKGGPVSVITIVAHWSMIRLPEKPMQPRLFDNRVGFFSVDQTDFGTTEQRSVQKAYITRWRLEKKDPNAALSEPVKPIIYYIDPATPDQWKPWIKKGVEEWQSAFEAAGFRNAIIAMDPPADPDWSMEDVRNTVVRWLPSTTQNSQGPHVHDPRTGEILNGSIRMFHNILSLNSEWYFTQVAPLDKRAQRLPLPDSLAGRLLQYVVAHEVGHTLGLQHNMKASSLYPVDSLRSRSWLKTMGYSPSIMDYSRFNYVAQPEDSIPPEYLVPRVGPYDKFAIMWGYKPVSSANTPVDEKPALNSWARMQDTVPWYRFSTAGSNGADPGDQSEAVGDADAVRATELGIRNIKRIVPMLIPATTREGEDNSDLARMYEQLVAQWQNEMFHVADIVGGVESVEKHGGQPGPRFTPVTRDKQRRAVQFLNDNVFSTPYYLIDPTVLRRIESDGAMARVRSAQSSVLSELLEYGRLTRMVEFSALSPTASNYTVAELLSDLRRGVWKELDQKNVSIDAFRRSMQSIYIQQIGVRVRPQSPYPGYRPTYLNPDAYAQARGELIILKGEIRSAISRSADSITKLHLLSSLDQIEEILNPNK